MEIGLRGWIIGLGGVLCGIFAIAFSVGGWLSYFLAAGGAVAVSTVFAVLSCRSARKTQQALDLFLTGSGLESGFPEVGDDALSRAVYKLGDRFVDCRNEKLFYQNVLNFLDHPVIVVDGNGEILICTQTVSVFFNKPVEQIAGLSVGKAFPGQEVATVIDQAVHTQQMTEKQIELALLDGCNLPVRLVVSPMQDHDGQFTGCVCSFVDETQTVAQEKEIREQRENMFQAGEQLSGLAEHVASATELLSAAADDQAQGAQKQKNQTSSVATAMDEMTATVLEVAGNANATNEAAGQADESANAGGEMVRHAVSAINEASQSVEQLGSEIEQLNGQAEEIGRVIGVISDIADQTNLLALNAAIEAARAGDAGRGFAVVADEVRKLAGKTVLATKEVEEAIGTIQHGSRGAMNFMRRTEEQVKAATDLSNQAGEALNAIVESIDDVVGRVSQIAATAEEQSTAAEEINNRVDEIAVIARDADEAAAQVAGATRDLAGLAQELLDVSKDFRDGGGESRLRESHGEMKGVLLKLTQEFVGSKYGDDIYAGMQEELGHPVFLLTDSYPDQVLMQMAEWVAAQIGVSVRDFFLALGRFTVGKFHEMYPGYFKDESLKEFYLRMNDVHAQLTKEQPGIRPPRFTYEDKGDDLFINYHSTRGLFDYFEGILLGAAKFKGERVTIEIKPFDESSARAEIVFHGKV